MRWPGRTCDTTRPAAPPAESPTETISAPSASGSHAANIIRFRYQIYEHVLWNVPCSIRALCVVMGYLYVGIITVVEGRDIQ